ncbi:MAG: PIN domain-containing protein [Thermofilaceae archaeon]|nr:PIN domain-containing protein [Thermofilaceae archaeon]MCX8179966.1 PIN domain-containing protein [Thermofilaceae archaeon]MDW8004729.1 PIN domain-containing protein [Thermofilaceae archaeon]
MLVLDTNVLVYATVEDSEHYSESLKLLNEDDSVIPQIVVYEFLKVILELTRDPRFLYRKVVELAERSILCEPLNVVQLGVELWVGDGAPAGELNDYIILALAVYNNAELATFDKKFRKVAEAHGVKVLP